MHKTTGVRDPGATSFLSTVVNVQDERRQANRAVGVSAVGLAVTGVVDLVDSIAQASKEQSAGIDQVNHAVVVMDRVTQQNAAFVQDGAQAAAALKSQAEVLRSAVRVFQL